jgi:hypothetical protein
MRYFANNFSFFPLGLVAQNSKLSFTKEVSWATHTKANDFSRSRKRHEKFSVANELIK